MDCAGIICEYNPFHNGHARQFAKIRQTLGARTPIVCLMSGNFVQRGEPALYPRRMRAEAAVRGGANLVLELPVTCALRSAEGFAAGGVEILDALGVCTHLSFGCETDAPLQRTAQLLESPEFVPVLRRYLGTGLPFAAARQRALEELGGDGAALASPNNLLGVEYCKALQAQKSRLQILPVPRPGSYHASVPEKENPAASALRQTEDFLPYVPEATRGVYAGAPQYRLVCGERAMLARLRAMPEAEWAALPFGSEGLWRKLRSAVRSGAGLQQALFMAKSKRYAFTRLSRLAMCAYLGLPQALLQQRAPYVRVLGFDDIGRALLRQAKETSRLPLVMPGQRLPESEFSQLEARAGLLYSLFCESAPDASAQKERVFYLAAPEKNEKGLAK